MDDTYNAPPDIVDNKLMGEYQPQQPLPQLICDSLLGPSNHGRLGLRSRCTASYECNMSI